jgi:hypothetical protein
VSAVRCSLQADEWKEEAPETLNAAVFEIESPRFAGIDFDMPLAEQRYSTRASI